jgi:hypothetical protein
MPNVLSIDVGIKNLSFCLLKVTESLTHPHHHTEIRILKWNVLNINDADEVKPAVKRPDVHCTTKPGCKLKPAYFYINGVADTGANMYACKRHYKTAVADTRRVFEMKPAHISKVLKTFTLEKMRDFCAEHETQIPSTSKNKTDVRAVVRDIFKTKYVYPVDQSDLYASLLDQQVPPPPPPPSVNNNDDAELSKSKKLTPVSSKSSASTVSLVFVGYNLMKMFDALFYGHLQEPDGCLPVVYAVDTVVIENQISPIANRMKTVQGMITQYFLMRGVDKRRIIYFSAVQKLKVAPYHFVFHTSSQGEDADVVDDIQTYDERKKAGVACVRKILSNANAVSGSASPTPKLFSIVHPELVSNSSKSKVDWLHVFESHSKKDDMADAFLQGLSYIVKTENK